MKKSIFIKDLKNNKGITLVALIVTIIILLILAGITISRLSKSGLLEKANLAKEKTENAEKEENLILKEYEEYIDGTRETITIDKEVYENMQGQLTTLNTKLNELEANYNILSSQVQNFSAYPKGEKILLDSGDFSTAKTNTAPGDGWIQLEMEATGQEGKWYELSVGQLRYSKW